MIIETTRFGVIDISEESILHMPDGMLGFEAYERYVLLEDRPDTPFKWLQAVDEPGLAFIVANPMEFFPDYDIDLPNDEAELLDLEDSSDAALLATVTVDKEEERVTLNLLGPVIINSQSLKAKQVVLQDDRYGTKCVIGENTRIDASLEPAEAA